MTVPFQLPPPGGILASPSQFASAHDCYRKWWFRTIHKVKDGKKQGPRDIGTVLHEVCARWLGANDQGRDASGQLVDLYPAGWERVREFGKETGRSIGLAEQAFVRKMVVLAIQNGTLRRLPQRQPERHIRKTIIPGVDAQGYIDQDAPLTVEDHKTTKNTTYAMGKAKLAADVKMMSYAAMKSSEEPDKAVTLRLNYYTKDASREPWPVEFQATPEHIERFRAEILVPLCTEMLRLFKAQIPVEQWDTVPGPNRKGACEDYGGCDYAKICSRIVPVDVFKELVKAARAAETEEASQPPKQKKTKNMGHFSKRKTAPAATAPTTTTAAPTAPAEPATPEAPTAPALATPPWHKAGCHACAKTPGINGKGEPCRACDVVQGRLGGPTSSQYRVWVDEGGVLRWEPAQGAEIVQTPKPKKEKASKPKAEPKATATPQAPETTPAAPIPTTPSAPPADDAVVIPKPAEGVILDGGFMLCIGCMPVGVVTLDISELLAVEGLELAMASGKESYFELDAFARRDALAAKAKVIAGGVKVVAVTAPSEMTPDERSLLTALRPYAKLVLTRT